MQFLTKEEKENHILKEHQMEYICDICNKTCDRKVNLFKHIMNIHINKKKTCYLCKKKISVRKCIPKDLVLYSKHTCPLCDTFIRNNNIVRHIKLCEPRTPEEREIKKKIKY